MSEQNATSEQSLEELQRAIDELARHNWDLKTLILRYGDKDLKARLDKLMKQYSVPYSTSSAA